MSSNMESHSALPSGLHSVLTSFGLVALLLSSVLTAQEPALREPPSPTFGWTKSGLYMTRSDKRPFRIFLDPEMDFAPYGYYLPAWKLIWPEDSSSWDSFKQPRFHIQGNQLHTENNVTWFYLVKEDQSKDKKIYGTNPYEQWFGSFSQTTGEMRAIRWGLFDFSGAPVEFKDYASTNGIVINDKSPGWDVVRRYLRGEPERERIAQEGIKKVLGGPGTRAPDFLKDK